MGRWGAIWFDGWGAKNEVWWLWAVARRGGQFEAPWYAGSVHAMSK
jgi:hypothetical protein